MKLVVHAARVALIQAILFGLSGAAQAAVTLYQFDVTSQLLGPRQLYISDNIIRIDCPKDGLTIISKKPFNHVTCFNNSSKRICELTSSNAVRELRNLGLIISEAGEVTLSWSKVGPESIQGVPCIAYKAKVTHTEARPDKADEVDWRKYWVRTDIAVPKSAGDILSASVNAPAIAGIPQRMEHFGSETDFNIPFLSRSNIDSKKKTLRVIITNKSMKKISVPERFFEIPKNYKSCKDIKKVLLHSGGIESLQDAGKAPGFLFEGK